MGYPMTYARVVRRNSLDGGYGRDPGRTYTGVERVQATIAGDMRRMEANQRDDLHLCHYAIEAGITPEQVKIVLDAFFAGHFLRATAAAFQEQFPDLHTPHDDYFAAAERYREDEDRIRMWAVERTATDAKEG